jgi:hypothetical protein
MTELPEAVLEQLFEETKDLIRAQREVGARVDTQASQILRFNAILIGLLVTGASLGLRLEGDVLPRDPVAVGGYAGGAALLVASTILAVLSYRNPVYRVGLHPGEIRGMLDQSVDRRNILRRALVAYTRGVEKSQRSLDTTTLRLEAALWALVASLSLVLTSTAIVIL